jgi:hypothetical protein
VGSEGGVGRSDGRMSRWGPVSSEESHLDQVERIVEQLVRRRHVHLGAWRLDAVLVHEA